MNLNVMQTLRNYARVLKISKKPDFGEFSETAKICFAGLVVVGAIGFVVYLISVALPLG